MTGFEVGGAGLVEPHVAPHSFFGGGGAGVPVPAGAGAGAGVVATGALGVPVGAVDVGAG